MKRLHTLISLIILALLLLGSPYTQAGDVDIDEIQKDLPKLLGQSNVGREFWFTIPPCYEDESGGAANFIKIFVTSPVKTMITCEVPGTGYFAQQSSKPNDVIGFDIEPAKGQPFLFSGRNNNPVPERVYPGRGVHVYADDPLVVYVVVRYRATSDGFLAIPVSGFGTEYVSATTPDMVAMYPWAKSFPSMTGVVAAYDGTKLRFTTGGNVFTETAGGVKAGQSVSFNMMRGDVVMFMANGMEQDLTGSKIVASKPVGVVSGNHCANIPTMNRWCDYVVEMDLPVHAWGKGIPVGRVPLRTYSGIVRIFAGAKDTKVWRDGNEIMTIPDYGGILGRGYQEMRVYPQKGPRNGFFKADKPFSITFYNPGVEEDVGSSNSDPFIMAMTPIEQFQKEILFNTPAVAGGLNFPENYLNLVYEVDENGMMPNHIEFGEVKNGIVSWKKMNSQFSGQDLPFNDTYNDKQYALKTLLLPHDGVYRIRSETPFACYSFGYSSYDSYGYPTSAAIADLSKPDVDAPDPKWELDCTGDVIGATVTDMPDDPEIRSNLADIIFRTELSFNYDWEYDDIIPGATITAGWRLTVRDPFEDARAVIDFKDRAGNDTTIQIDYYAVKLDIIPNHFFGSFTVGETSTKDDFIVRNLNEMSPVIIPDESYLRLKSGAEGFNLTTNITFPLTLQPLEEKEFSITFRATQAGEFRDSVGVGDTCVFRYFIEVSAFVGTPGIYVTDIDFGRKPVGSTTTLEATVYNTSTDSDMEITGYLTNTKGVYTHTVADQMTFPLTIQKNGSRKFEVTFKPDDIIAFPDEIIFLTDAPGDSVCIIKGEGYMGTLYAQGVVWDILRINQPHAPRSPYPGPENIKLWVEGNDAVTVRSINVIREENPGDATAFVFDEDLILGSIATSYSQTNPLEVPVTFLPEHVGKYEVELEFVTNGNQSEYPTAVLTGWGKVGHLTITQNLDFTPSDPMVANDMNDMRTMDVTITNDDSFEYSDTVNVFDLLIGANANDISENIAQFGNQGFKYDGTLVFAENPIVLGPGEIHTFSVDFVAPARGDFTATIETESDATMDDMCSLEGRGWIEGFTVGNDGTSLCLGTPTMLTIPFQNTEDTELEIIDLQLQSADPNILSDIGFVTDYVGTMVASGDPLNININYTPSRGDYDNVIVDVVVTVGKKEITNPTEVKIGQLTLSSEYYERDTRSLVTVDALEIGFDTKYVLQLTAGDNIANANLTELSILITHPDDFLHVDPNSIAVGDDYKVGFTFKNDPIINDLDGYTEIRVDLISTGAGIVNAAGDLLSMVFKSYLPYYEDEAEEFKETVATISAVISETNDCAEVYGSEVNVNLLPPCVNDLRAIVISTQTYSLGEVIPNPVGTGGADIEFAIAYDDFTEIRIFNSAGELVATPVATALPKGSHSFRVPVEKLSSGTYIYEMRAGAFIETKKLVIRK